jgi:hypothetical protein
MNNTKQFTTASTATATAFLTADALGKSTGFARLVLLSQVGRLHFLAKEDGAKIADALEPAAKGAAVSVKTLQKLTTPGRAIFDKFGALEPLTVDVLSDADKLSAYRQKKTTAARAFNKAAKALEASDSPDNARKFGQSLAGVKVDRTDKERATDKAESAAKVRTLAAANVDGDAATANLSDDPKTASLQWVALGVDAAKKANVEWSEWLRMSGMHQTKAVKA